MSKEERLTPRTRKLVVREDEVQGNKRIGIGVIGCPRIECMHEVVS
jgi:hypothetical protein